MHSCKKNKCANWAVSNLFAETFVNTEVCFCWCRLSGPPIVLVAPCLLAATIAGTCWMRRPNCSFSSLMKKYLSPNPDISKLFVVQVYALCLFLQHLVTAMLSYIFLNHRLRAKLEWFIYSDCLIWPHYICQFFLGVYNETDELYFFWNIER